MERSRVSSGESMRNVTVEKKLAERRRRSTEAVADLTDFMTDMFFGTVDMENKSYDLTGGIGMRMRGVEEEEEEDEIGFDDSTRSDSSRMTEEWLQEARLVVANSPTNRFLASPKFGASQPISPSRSRSARRNRAVEGFGGEILSKTVNHSRNKSDTFNDDGDDGSPATAVHRWFANILKPTNHTPSSPPAPDPTLSSSSSSSSLPFPSRRSFNRKSRFQTDLNGPPLSPSNTLPLSPPRNPTHSALRRTISSSTCSLNKITPRPDAINQGDGIQDHPLNGFLQEQRVSIQKVMNGKVNFKVKIVLSGPSNSTTSMVAAICYAWLMEHREREKDAGRENLVVPVMNVRRSSMWNLRQAASLFHHAALDSSSLLFADEVDLESLMMSGRLNILVVGQDILNTPGEVGSLCTILTDNYCEEAYDLLQTPALKKLLLSGILLDTHNLKASASLSMTRDAEAVQLLLVGSAPNYRYTLFDQLIQDQKATSFIEALHHNYGKPPDESDQDGEGNMEHRVRDRKSISVSDHEVAIPNPKKNFVDTRGAKTNKFSAQSGKLISPPLQSPSPAPARANKEASGGKNKFFLARWFGFGSK